MGDGGHGGAERSRAAPAVSREQRPWSGESEAASRAPANERRRRWPRPAPPRPVLGSGTPRGGRRAWSGLAADALGGRKVSLAAWFGEPEPRAAAAPRAPPGRQFWEDSRDTLKKKSQVSPRRRGQVRCGGRGVFLAPEKRLPPQPGHSGSRGHCAPHGVPVRLCFRWSLSVPGSV